MKVPPSPRNRQNCDFVGLHAQFFCNLLRDNGQDTSADTVPSDSKAFASRSSSDTRLVLICSVQSPQFTGKVAGPARRSCVIRHDYVCASLLPRQEFFQLFVPFEATGWLASLLLTAYTEICRDLNRVPAGSFLSNIPGTLAAERECLPRRPSLTQAISSESFIR